MSMAALGKTFTAIGLCLTMVMASCGDITAADLGPYVLDPVKGWQYEYANYNAGRLHKQLLGWPISDVEREYCNKSESYRRPGTELTTAERASMTQAQLDKLMGYFPTTPTPQDYTLGTHASLVDVVRNYRQDHGDDLDILLIGDSITAQWCGMPPERNSSNGDYNKEGVTTAPYEYNKPGAKLQPFNAGWNSQFKDFTAVNIGIGGDRTQSVLWRLDHGGADGLNPKVVVLAIGHNDMFFTGANQGSDAGSTGYDAAARGILCCLQNVLAKFPNAHVVMVKILPSYYKNDNRFIIAPKINAKLDSYGLGDNSVPHILSDADNLRVHVLPDMWNDWLNPATGELNYALFRDKSLNSEPVHPSQPKATPDGTSGYELYAKKLSPLVKSLLNGSGRIYFASDTYQVNKSGGDVTVVVKRLGGAGVAATVQFSTRAGTAVAGTDFTATSGTLNWAVGDTSERAIQIHILNNSAVSGSKTLSLALSSVTGSVIGDAATASVTILDDQTPGIIGFSSSNATWVTEQGGDVQIAVSRRTGRTGVAKVNFKTVDVPRKTTAPTLSDAATAGVDYTSTSGTLTWADGDSADKLVTLHIRNDGNPEGSEVFNVVLEGVTGASLDSVTTQAMTIADDDAPAITLYDDVVLGGWYQNGYYGTLDIACTSAVANGVTILPKSGTKMFEASLSGGEVGIINQSGAFDSSSYEKLTFWINGGVGGQTLKLGNSSFTLQPNVWVQKELLLSDMGYATVISTLRFTAADAATYNKKFYFDQMVLVPKPLGAGKVPTVTTAAVTNPAWYQATLAGALTAAGDATVKERGVCWGLYENPTKGNEYASLANGTVGSFTRLVANLTPGVTYHVRAYAENYFGTGYGADVTFTTPSLPVQNAANRAPTVANPILDQTATVGTLFSYTIPINTFIDQDGDILALSVTGLPWATFNAATRIISGTPTTVGPAMATVKADDGKGGTVTSVFSIVVVPAVVRPAVTTIPVLGLDGNPATTVAGVWTLPVRMMVTPTAGATYQWARKLGSATAFTAIDGATGSTFEIASVRATDAGQYQVTVSGVASNPITLVVPTRDKNATATGDAGPWIITEPTPVQVLGAGGAVLSVEVIGGPGCTYQWQKYGPLTDAATGVVSSQWLPVSGATSATYTTTTAGLYRASISTSSGGWMISDPALVKAASATPTLSFTLGTSQVLRTVGGNGGLPALETYTYNAPANEPQPTGSDLTFEERLFLSQTTDKRIPMSGTTTDWSTVFQTPIAQNWGPSGWGGQTTTYAPNAWTEQFHQRLVQRIRSRKDTADIVLIGDSITYRWGADGVSHVVSADENHDKQLLMTPGWQTTWAGTDYIGNDGVNGPEKVVNLGIKGDTVGGVLWRLEHGLLEGAAPKVVVLLAGTNDMNRLSVYASGRVAAGIAKNQAIQEAGQLVAKGIASCVRNIRGRCPTSEVVLVKILPRNDPIPAAFSVDRGLLATATNGALNALTFDSKVHVLDLTDDFVKKDPTTGSRIIDPVTGNPVLNADYFTVDNLHPSEAGYKAYAAKLKGLIDSLGLLATPGTITLEASLSAPAAKDVKVPLTFGGTAVQGANYRVSPNRTAVSTGSITIPAGSRKARITLELINDAAQTVDQTVTVTMGNPVDAALATLGSQKSHTLTITAMAPVAPLITTQPAKVTVTVGTVATFKVVATGTPAPTYQWRKGGMAIPGATGANYTTPVTTIADNTSSYSVVVTNSAGTVTSNNAVLTVIPANVAPVITAQPANVTTSTTATFKVVATGTPTPTYQWKKDGLAIPGATSASYTTLPTTLADSGARYSVVVTNSVGSVTSTDALLTVMVITGPLRITLGQGVPAQVTLIATGSPTSFSAVNLPAGLTLSNAGLISGSPRTLGTTQVNVTASNAEGSGTTVVTIIVITPIEAFVTRFYEQCLNRAPDANGLSSWSSALASGTQSGVDVARGFILSPEFGARNLSDSDFLKVVYRAFFDRDPDTAGQTTWQAQLSAKVLREDVLYGFILSQEFSTLCQRYGITAIDTEGQNAYNVRQFVRRFYQQCLSREPDAQGIVDWTNKLIQGSLLGVDVARGFVLSQEFRQRTLTDQAYLTILYKAFFNRNPDAGGNATWLNEMAAGKSRQVVLDGFIFSAEFSALCAQYGIIPFATGG